MRRIHLTMHAGTRRGQTLLVAVLLMMAILLVGILFVALVTYNQSQSVRHEDSLAAQAMAEAGISYATYMLENSPEGADWRPPQPPAMFTDGNHDLSIYGPDQTAGTEDDYYTDMELTRGWAPLIDGAVDAYERSGFTRFPDPRHPAGTTTALASNIDGGYFFLRVSYSPWDPNFDFDAGVQPDPMDWHIKIESIGRVEGTQVYREMVAYKPIPTLNYSRWVHDATGEGREAFLGIPAWVDMDQTGTIVDTPIGASLTPPEWISTSITGPIRVNGRLRIAGHPWDTGTEIFGSTRFDLYSRMDLADLSSGGYPRDDTIEVTGGIDFLTNVAGAAQVTLETDSTSDYILMRETEHTDFVTLNGRIRDGQQSTVVEANLDGSGDGAFSRFAGRIEAPRLTLGEGETAFDRYRKLTRDSGELVVTTDGDYVNSGQWGFGAGIYIDNFTDIQYGHDIQDLIDDWQRPTGTSGTPQTDSGWNALFTTYAPPAVEIEFLPTEAAAGSFSSDLATLSSGDVWWPDHEAGQPGIKITRHDDRTWRAPDGGDSEQRTLVRDYPTPWLDGSDNTQRYPVIVAEGNVRVSGQLPPAMADAVGMNRSYDTTIVSGGTIYIDGQLLAPNDYLADADEVAAELNTKVALFARDSVCLNATQIVPQNTFGTAPAVPDDPLNPADPNKHWELSPGSDGRGYSLFYWGDEPIGTSAALVVRQAAADPGPSGVSLTLWDEVTDDYTPYEFGAAPAPMANTTFALVPEETFFPEDPVVFPPQPYGAVAIAPQWAPYRVEDGTGTLVLPWDLAGYLTPTPGLKNAVTLKHADPHLGAGSTAYRLKKWKIAEYNDDGDPVGGINAKVNASVFAERGCWYVLSPGYFDENLTVATLPDLLPAEARALVIENRRYNYRLTFIGTIAENFTASVEAAQDWHNKTAYPERWENGDLAEWGSIRYIFDDTLRVTRFHSTVSKPTHPAANIPRLPLLPVSPDLVYYGE